MPTWFVLSTLVLGGLSPEALPERVLDARLHHLGDDRTPEWPEASAEPEGRRLALSFEAHTENRERTLRLTQRDVDADWILEVNGVEIARLRKEEARRICFYAVPAGSIREGRNELRLQALDPGDDVVVGEIALLAGTLRESLRLRPLRVRVSEAGTRKPLPARVVVTLEGSGALADLYYAEGETRAVRGGVVYTSEGLVTMELAPGDYRIHASRGMEWGLASKRVRIEAGGSLDASLELAREVDTTGFVACDTHVHTYTFSGHGDASVEERLVTLAGEGIELAVATDHNHQTDYLPAQRRMDLEDAFVAVTGNEVTTENGHFNAFPLDPEEAVPDHRLADWVRLVEEMREKGARVVVLNHPRWPDPEKGPFGLFDLDRLTGERKRGPRFTFDAMELANSSVMLEDPLALFRDWFSLLNHGESIAAVGSSDSHTVRAPVGEGRTYVRSSTDDPTRLDLEEIWDHMLRGEMSLSLGLFADARVNGRGMGRVVPPEEGLLDVDLRIAAPSWARPTRARVFLNGLVAREEEIESPPGRPMDRRLHLRIPAPAQDAHLVCVVTGEEPAVPIWRTAARYTLAATNPILVDGDGDGRYRSPRDTARALLAEGADEPSGLLAAIGRMDDAVALQLLALLREGPRPEDRIRAREAALQFPDRPLLQAFARSLPASP